jgi:hypothetical protein
MPGMVELCYFKLLVLVFNFFSKWKAGVPTNNVTIVTIIEGGPWIM